MKLIQLIDHSILKKYIEENESKYYGIEEYFSSRDFKEKVDQLSYNDTLAFYVTPLDFSTVLFDKSAIHNYKNNSIYFRGLTLFQINKEDTSIKVEVKTKEEFF